MTPEENRRARRSARKYDVITALGRTALSLGKHDQRLVLRLITVLTARYNWARDELAVGQREIARLWSVDERTVKREMAQLRGAGWLVVKRQGARGRVTEYALGLDRILSDTKEQWACVGIDFELRMGQGDLASEKVVPMPLRTIAVATPVCDGSEWSIAQSLLHTEDRSTFAAWLQALRREGRAGGSLTLRAPSRFHAVYVQTHLERRILAACRTVDEAVTEVRIIA
ncbi:MAG: hypothetical protein HC814_01360 [Rhodobacteraceae bacterium]|nr:hypothetical protein [Paracoccaceae bacterium]